VILPGGPLPGALPEIVVADALSADPRAWVPQTADVSFLPLCLSLSQGFYVNLLRVRRAGVLSRHYHAQPVHGWVLKGRWRYREHDWEATPGTYVFEPPGEVHTLEVPGDVDEMITLFHVAGALIYVDDAGRPCGHDDAFTKHAAAAAHYAANGLGAGALASRVR
jgi:quercetin dioxygenase-like cupin family protein